MPKTKALILLTVFIDVIGFGIVIPILPFYVAGFNPNPFVITALFSVYAICSFLSAPVIGAISDRIGRRPMLILSIASTSAGWFIFASAPSLLFLFIGRIVDGLAAGNLPIAQSYLGDISKDAKERASNLGLIGMVFGIGFILGPFLGGFLGSFGHTVPFWFVGGLALANTILALFFLPETHTEREVQEKISINPFTPIRRAIMDDELRPNYLSWFLFGLAIAGFQAIFALYINRTFGFNEFMGGLIFSFIGVVVAINQGVAMKHLWLKYFREPDLELGMLVSFMVGFVLMAIPRLWVFAVALLLTTFGQSVLRVVMMSQVAGKASPARRGEVMGVMSSLVSLSMAVSPLFSGSLFAWSPAAPFFLSGFFLMIAFAVLFKKRRALGTAMPDENAPIDSMI